MENGAGRHGRALGAIAVLKKKANVIIIGSI
jgi:hypothetical protein